MLWSVSQLLYLLLGFIALYLLVVGAFMIAGRRGIARAIAGFVPDCVVLFTRLLRDERLPRRDKYLVAALVPYLAMPFDLIPDFIPIAGQIDDAILVAIVIAYVCRRAGRQVIVELWPGSERGLQIILAGTRAS